MLKQTIEEVLKEIQPEIENIEQKIEAIAEEIKSTAKNLFFQGKINDLKDFLLNIPNERNEEIKKRFLENISPIISNAEEFIDSFKIKLEAKIDEFKKEKNLDSLLDILDYGHLKDMLKMFKL